MRILFVDDEEQVLRGLDRLTSTLEGEWTFAFANSGARALELLRDDPFDVVVSDLRMPGMCGGDLLRAIQARYPEVVRVVLSGQADQTASVKAAGAAHQFLAKPCDATELLATFERAEVIKGLIAEPRLRGLVSRLPSVPSAPAAYESLLRELDDADVSMERVASIMGSDVAMSAKVLQLVNSSFFGLSRTIVDVRQAAQFLGLDVIRALVVAAQAFSMFPPRGENAAAVEAIQAHSLHVSSVARRIAADDGQDKGGVDAAAAAGMLHEIGALVLATVVPDAFRHVEQRRELLGDRWSAERQLLGTTSATVGAYLLGAWGLPLSVVRALVELPEPSYGGQGPLSTGLVVHLADCFVEAGGIEGTDVDRCFNLLAPSIANSAAGCEAATAAWHRLTTAAEAA